jgi:hypothetical protein
MFPHQRISFIHSKVNQIHAQLKPSTTKPPNDPELGGIGNEEGRIGRIAGLAKKLVRERESFCCCLRKQVFTFFLSVQMQTPSPHSHSIHFSIAFLCSMPETFGPFHGRDYPCAIFAPILGVFLPTGGIFKPSGHGYNQRESKGSSRTDPKSTSAFHS